jgi:uncharacterized repeat protein (TIGR01451 family)
VTISALNNGAYYDDTSINSGTGNYDAFVRIQASPIEEGFNTDENKVLDNKDGNFTNSIQFGSFTVVTKDFGDGEQQYVEFRLDINESPNAVTLTELKIYLSSGPATEADYPSFAGFTNIFDLGGTVSLLDHESGSGKDDYGFYIPLSAFAGATNNTYVTLYSSFSGSDGGFEEWRTLTQDNPGGGGGGEETLGYSIDKTVFDVGGDGALGVVDEAGDVITYKIEVGNTGTVALSGVSVADPLLADLTNDADNDNVIDGDTNGDGLLDTDETWVYTGTYTVLQSDIDNNGGGDGDIDNTATVSHLELEDLSSSASVNIEQNPHLTVVKDNGGVVDANGSGRDDAGDEVVYEYSVENDGNVTLFNVTLDDDKLGAISLTGLTDEDGDGDADDLAVGATATGTSTATLSQDDLDAGSVTNIATGTGTDPNDDPVTDNDTNTVDIEQLPNLTVTKDNGGVVDANGSGRDDAGDEIVYEYSVTNDGNVSLFNVTLDDDKLGAITLAGLTDVDGDGDADDLAVGATATGTSTATLSQDDLDAGSVTNIATGTGTDPNDDPVTDNDTNTVDVEQLPHLIVTKTNGGVVDKDGNGHDVGDEIVYQYGVTNDGNVSLFNISLDDDKLGTITLTGLTDLDNDGDADDLAVGATATGTATATLTQANIDLGTLTNVATGTGEGPKDQPVEDTDTNTVVFTLNSDGYSQGFWKTHIGDKPQKTAWNDGISPSDTYEGAKGVDMNTGLADNITFKQVLETASLKPVQTNQELALAKQVVAALLNAADTAGGGDPLSNKSSDFNFTTADIKAAVASVYDGAGFYDDSDGDQIRDSEELQKVLDFYNKENVTVQGSDPMYMTSLMGTEQDGVHYNYLTAFS